jgi:hypothetical protein
MARAKLIVRKHVCALPCWNVMPSESHSDGQHADYFLRSLQTLLLVLGYSEPPFFIGVPRLLCGNSYHWCVRVIIYERLTTDHIRRIHHVVEATTPRWTLEGGMREATRQALVLLRHEADEQMEHLQYCHFLSCACVTPTFYKNNFFCPHRSAYKMHIKL